MTIPTITTPRLILRPFGPADAEPLYRILMQEGILQYFPPSTPVTPEKAQRIVEHQLAHWAEHGLGWWAVQPRDGDTLIGWNGLQFLPETGEVEVGYLLSKDAWGKGYATEGARAGLQFGFETLGLGTIIGLVHPANIASQRVLLKCGMTFVAEAEYFGMALRKYTLDLRRPLGFLCLAGAYSTRKPQRSQIIPAFSPTRSSPPRAHTASRTPVRSRRRRATP